MSNPLIEELYIMCNEAKLSPESYHKFRKEMVDTLVVRGYSLGWKCKYFIKLLVWKSLGI